MDHDLIVAIGDERFVHRIRSHVEAAARGIQKAPDKQKRLDGATCYELDRLLTAKKQSIMRTVQPGFPFLLVRVEDSQSLMNAQHSRNARQHIDVQRDV